MIISKGDILIKDGSVQAQEAKNASADLKAAETLYDLLSEQATLRRSAVDSNNRASRHAHASRVAGDCAALCKTGSDEEKDCLFVQASQAHQAQLWLGVAGRSEKAALALGQDIRSTRAVVERHAEYDFSDGHSGSDKVPLDPQDEESRR